MKISIQSGPQLIEITIKDATAETELEQQKRENEDAINQVMRRALHDAPFADELLEPRR